MNILAMMRKFARAFASKRYARFRLKDVLWHPELVSGRQDKLCGYVYRLIRKGRMVKMDLQRPIYMKYLQPLLGTCAMQIEGTLKMRDLPLTPLQKRYPLVHREISITMSLFGGKLLPGSAVRFHVTGRAAPFPGHPKRHMSFLTSLESGTLQNRARPKYQETHKKSARASCPSAQDGASGAP